MTVTTAMIAQVSPFTVGPTGDFTQTDFDQYATWAALELAKIDPGVDSDTYDYCHALLICHFYDLSRGDGGSTSAQYQSEKIGDYSYTGSQSSGGDTIAPTSFYNRLLQTLAKWQSKQATTSTERDDSDTTYPSSEFALDQSDVGVFE